MTHVVAAAADHELIRDSWGEAGLFGAIFDRHAVAIHRYLARRVGASLADDLTAETFLVAFRGRARYDVAHADARPWLYGIAANLLRRDQRSELRQYRALARTGVNVGGLLQEQYLPPAVLAALFEAAATIPGTTVVPDAQDAAGRHGIAVSYRTELHEQMLIFDKSSYRYLGLREVAAQDGALIGTTAQLKITVVDRAGQSA
ncbi:MAG: sigma factor [Actinoplanes sp.]